MAEVKALLLGDLIGSSSCRALFLKLPDLIKLHKIDFVVVNGENAHQGFGLHPDQVPELFSAGVDVITSGNHIWEVPELNSLLEQEPRLLRPGNYDSRLPGRGWTEVTKNGRTWGVMNFQARLQMPLTENPFTCVQACLDQFTTPLLLVDFHGEVASEKEAFGHFLDGRVSAVVGTHTHVATSDYRVLPGGTVYCTDLGCCGPAPSVIGGDVDASVQRLRTQRPVKMSLAQGPVILSGLVITLDETTGKGVRVEALRETVPV